MTQNEFTRRMAEIDARPVKTMTLEEEKPALLQQKLWTTVLPLLWKS